MIDQIDLFSKHAWQHLIIIYNRDPVTRTWWIIWMDQTGVVGVVRSLISDACFGVCLYIYTLLGGPWASISHTHLPSLILDGAIWPGLLFRFIYMYLIVLDKSWIYGSMYIYIYTLQLNVHKLWATGYSLQLLYLHYCEFDRFAN